MRQPDRKCSELCSYQANIFAKSRKAFICSSKVFLRRFFFSNFACHLDFQEFYTFSYDENECFESILKDYGDSTYGKIKIPEQVLYYIGYITRYICYTREVTSLFFYRTFGVDTLINEYYVLHTQSEEAVLKELLQRNNLTENIFDQNKLLKDILRKRYIKEGKF